MYSEYANDIFRFMYVNVRDVSIAEDLTADTFAKAWARLGSFDFRHTRGWLYTIARNRLADHWRTKQTELLNEEIEIEDERESVDALLDKGFEKEQLLTALAKLPENMRSILILRFIEGYSARQTAEALKMSEANVRVVQYRALKRLRGIMK